MENVKDGGCTCGAVRFRLKREPMFVHCCHCTWCQRASGSAFALNAIIETQNVELLAGEVERVDTPTASGRGQIFARCGTCHDTLWSHYAIPDIGDALSFVRVGALDAGHGITPSVHIFTSTRQPWLVLDDSVPVFEQYYTPVELWPADSMARRTALLGKAG